MSAPGRRYGTGVVLFVLAACYFSLGRTLSLEWTDEGMIVYPSWLVAGGATPYLEFRHVYGPSLFFLNGALFRLFGPDLAVIRLALVVVKAGVATSVYAASRALAPWPFAFLAYVLCVAVWGTPWWVFNTPYANHYSLLFNFLALLGFLALRHRFRLACAVAGVGFGLAATFKLTSGIFALVGFVLFLLWNTAAAGAAGSRTRSARLAWGVRLIRSAALAAAFAVPLAYVGRRNTVWNLLVLCAPLAVNIVLLSWREARARLDPEGRRRSVVGMLWAVVGLAAPLGVYVLYYAHLGSLDRLVADLLTELPSRFTWFVPLSAPDFRPTLLGFAAVSAVLAVWQWRRAPLGRSGIAVAALLLCGCLAALLVVVRDAAAAPGIRPYLFLMGWYGDVIPVVGAIPFVTVACVTFAIWRGAHRPGAPPRDGAESADGDSPLGVFYFFAVVSLLFLYPAADFWHLIMGLPAFLPLLAFVLSRCHRVIDAAPSARGGVWLSALTAAVVVLGLAAPYVSTLRFVLRTAPASPGWPRAPGIVGAAPKIRDAADLIGYLDTQPPDVPLFATGSEQMIYFLAGRRSAVDFDEFVLYLLPANAMDAAAVRALVPEERLIDHLRMTKPLIIDSVDGRLAGLFHGAFPGVTAFINAHYGVVHTAGAYRVLRWSDT